MNMKYLSIIGLILLSSKVKSQFVSKQYIDSSIMHCRSNFDSSKNHSYFINGKLIDAKEALISFDNFLIKDIVRIHFITPSEQWKNGIGHSTDSWVIFIETKKLQNKRVKCKTLSRIKKIIRNKSIDEYPELFLENHLISKNDFLVKLNSLKPKKISCIFYIPNESMCNKEEAKSKGKVKVWLK